MDDSSFSVRKPEELTIEKELQDQSLVTFDDLILECRIRGVLDGVAGYSWLYNDQLIDPQLFTLEQGKIELIPVSYLK